MLNQADKKTSLSITYLELADVGISSVLLFRCFNVPSERDDLPKAAISFFFVFLCMAKIGMLLAYAATLVITVMK